VGEASLAVVGCAGLWWVVMFGGRGVLTGRVFVEAWVTGDRCVVTFGNVRWWIGVVCICE
jgi:hypothetical protein